jgi:hypothetical protein
MAKKETKGIVYHKDHLPKDLGTDYEYSYNWDQVTDPVALKARKKEFTEAGLADQAADVSAQIKNIAEGENTGE